MPLVRISLLRGRTAEQIRAIGEGVHRALVETFAVPPDDRFQVVHQHEPGELIYDANYLGVPRTDGIVVIEITASRWRDAAQKRALYGAVARNLAADPGIRPEDVTVVLSPNERDDWSFGRGLASYAEEG